MLSTQRIKIIAAEEAHHVCESGAPNAKQHNARVLEQAIRRAIEAYSSENCMNVLIDDERHEYLLNCEKQLTTAQKETEGLKRDKARLDWLLTPAGNQSFGVAEIESVKGRATWLYCRELLDAAIAQKGPH